MINDLNARNIRAASLLQQNGGEGGKLFSIPTCMMSLNRILVVRVQPWYTIGSPSSPSQQSTEIVTALLSYRKNNLFSTVGKTRVSS